jgi:hypothetical protein
MFSQEGGEVIDVGRNGLSVQAGITGLEQLELQAGSAD